MGEKQDSDMAVDYDRRTKEKNFVGPTPEYVQEFIMSLFEKWTEGPSGVPGQCSVSLNSRRKDFFPADACLCSLKIGIEISEKFELQRGICFTWAMPDHSFNISDKRLEKLFYKKWPKEKISEQTMKEFSEMVYDLILIQNGYSPS